MNARARKIVWKIGVKTTARIVSGSMLASWAGQRLGCRVGLGTGVVVGMGEPAADALGAGLAVGAGVTFGQGGSLFSRNGVWPTGVGVGVVAGAVAGAEAVGDGLSAKASPAGSHMATARPSSASRRPARITSVRLTRRRSCLTGRDRTRRGPTDGTGRCAGPP